MKILLYWRGRELLDLEVRRTPPPPPESEPDDDGPTLRASGFLAASERAEGPVWQDDQPAVVHAFGFGR